MKSVLLLMLLTTLETLSINCFASDEINVAKEDNDGEQYVNSDLGSQHYRNDKTWMATAQLVGLGPGLFPSRGITFGYFISRDEIIVAEYGEDAYPIQPGVKRNEVEFNSLGIHYKRHFGNSFYWSGGFNYRQVDIFHNWQLHVTSGNLSYQRVRGESLALSFYLGNQWQWKNFTLGCDWLGYTTSVFSNVFDEEVSADSGQFARGNHEDEKSLHLSGGHAQLLRFYLGYAM